MFMETHVTCNMNINANETFRTRAIRLLKGETAAKNRQTYATLKEELLNLLDLDYTTSEERSNEWMLDELLENRLMYY